MARSIRRKLFAAAGVAAILVENGRDMVIFEARDGMLTIFRAEALQNAAIGLPRRIAQAWVKAAVW